jgi:hypothetical protein
MSDTVDAEQPEVCRHCGQPVQWTVTDYRLALSDDEELVGYRAVCTATCEKSVTDGALPDGRGERSVWEPRYWPRA